MRFSMLWDKNQIRNAVKTVPGKDLLSRENNLLGDYGEDYSNLSDSEQIISAQLFIEAFWAEYPTQRNDVENAMAAPNDVLFELMRAILKCPLTQLDPQIKRNNSKLFNKLSTDANTSLHLYYRLGRLIESDKNLMAGTLDSKKAQSQLLLEKYEKRSDIIAQQEKEQEEENKRAAEKEALEQAKREAEEKRKEEKKLKLLEKQMQTQEKKQKTKQTEKSNIAHENKPTEAPTKQPQEQIQAQPTATPIINDERNVLLTILADFSDDDLIDLDKRKSLQKQLKKAMGSREPRETIYAAFQELRRQHLSATISSDYMTHRSAALVAFSYQQYRIGNIIIDTLLKFKNLNDVPKYNDETLKDFFAKHLDPFVVAEMPDKTEPLSAPALFVKPSNVERFEIIISTAMFFVAECEEQYISVLFAILNLYKAYTCDKSVSTQNALLVKTQDNSQLQSSKITSETIDLLNLIEVSEPEDIAQIRRAHSTICDNFRNLLPVNNNGAFENLLSNNDARKIIERRLNSAHLDVLGVLRQSNSTQELFKYGIYHTVIASLKYHLLNKYNPNPMIDVLLQPVNQLSINTELQLLDSLNSKENSILNNQASLVMTVSVAVWFVADAGQAQSFVQLDANAKPYFMTHGNALLSTIDNIKSNFLSSAQITETPLPLVSQIQIIAHLIKLKISSEEDPIKVVPLLSIIKKHFDQEFSALGLVTINGNSIARAIDDQSSNQYAEVKQALIVKLGEAFLNPLINLENELEKVLITCFSEANDASLEILKLPENQGKIITIFTDTCLLLMNSLNLFKEKAPLKSAKIAWSLAQLLAFKNNISSREFFVKLANDLSLVISEATYQLLRQLEDIYFSHPADFNAFYLAFNSKMFGDKPKAEVDAILAQLRKGLTMFLLKVQEKLAPNSMPEIILTKLRLFFVAVEYQLYKEIHPAIAPLLKYKEFPIQTEWKNIFNVLASRISPNLNDLDCRVFSSEAVWFVSAVRLTVPLIQLDNEKTHFINLYHAKIMEFLVELDFDLQKKLNKPAPRPVTKTDSSTDPNSVILKIPMAPIRSTFSENKDWATIEKSPVKKRLFLKQLSNKCNLEILSDENRQVLRQMIDGMFTAPNQPLTSHFYFQEQARWSLIKDFADLVAPIHTKKVVAHVRNNKQPSGNGISHSSSSNSNNTSVNTHGTNKNSSKSF